MFCGRSGKEYEVPKSGNNNFVATKSSMQILCPSQPLALIPCCIPGMCKISCNIPVHAYAWPIFFGCGTHGIGDPSSYQGTPAGQGRCLRGQFSRQSLFLVFFFFPFFGVFECKFSSFSKKTPIFLPKPNFEKKWMCQRVGMLAEQADVGQHIGRHRADVGQTSGTSGAGHWANVGQTLGTLGEFLEVET